MIVPVRCFSCGQIVASKYDDFKKRLDKGEKPGKIMDDLGVERYCCRRMLLSHVDLTDELAKFNTK